MQSIFLVAAKRTPFGSFGGSLKHISATELAVNATKAALKAGNVNPAWVDHVFFGNVIQSSPDAAYLARHVALKSSIPEACPALTVNRLCGSGFESIIQGAMAMQVFNAQITVCGGTENMSSAPMQLDGNHARWGVSLGEGLKLRDSLWDGLTDSHINIPMGITAENLAERYNISRRDCDEFAIRSQQLWYAAKRDHVFDLEIAPIEVPTKKGLRLIDTDEHPRVDSTIDNISQLKPVFKKDGVVTAANASGICDGAGVIILATENAINKFNLKPMARLLSFHVTGCDPKIMGIGPVSAINGALQKASLTLDDVDRIEINEAFAAQFLACAKELRLDMSKTNIHGGAISLGHPLGASGSRITAHLANEIMNTNITTAIGSACIGGGQGIAVVLQRV